MEIKDKNTTKFNGISEQIFDKNISLTLANELQITFPDQISHDVYHNAIEDYFESLNTILKKLT